VVFEDKILLKLHYDVKENDFSRAGEASSDVKKVLKKIGVNPESIRKLAISMYEAEINMVIHANGGEIDVYVSETYIKAVLKDRGPGIKDLSLAMQEGYSTATDMVRELGFGAGMGLPNIKKYSDDLKIDTKIGEGTTLEITVNI
jgi:anti-sigma regulatory factor (Ser/Thr protein kinase)